MKRIIICVAVLLMIFYTAGAEEAPETYAELREQYGLPDFAPCNTGMTIGQNYVSVQDPTDVHFTRGVIAYTDDEGNAVTVEGAYDVASRCWNWPEVVTGEKKENVWFLMLPADMTIELTGELSSSECYRTELVYRRVLAEEPYNTMTAMTGHLEHTGLRLYDQNGGKVLEVWPKAEGYELRCMAVTFYPEVGTEYTVEYAAEEGDVDVEAYTRMAQELTASNVALAHPTEAPDTLAEARALFPQADFTLDFTPVLDLDGTVKVHGIPAEIEVLYASFQLLDMRWFTTSSWNLTKVADGTYVLADPSMLPRVMGCMSAGTMGGMMMFYQDENGLIMHAQYSEAMGWCVSLSAVTEAGYISLSMLPYEVQLSCSDGNFTPLWYASYDLESGARTLFFEE